METSPDIVDTSESFKYHWKCWRWLGIHPTENHRFLYFLYSFAIITLSLSLNVSVTIQLFFAESAKTVLGNLYVIVSVYACGLKLFNTFLGRKRLLEVNQLIQQVDRSAKTKEEKEQLRAIVRFSHKLFRLASFGYVIVALAGQTMALMSRGQRLMLPAWFPFDLTASNLNYAMGFMHQFSCFVVVLFQELSSDTFSAVYLNVIFVYLNVIFVIDHIRVLNNRIRNVGNDSENSAGNNYRDLIKCIRDHRLLIRYFDSVHQVISRAVLLQLFVTGLELCIAAVYLLLIKGDFLEIVFLVTYELAIAAEIFIYCYFGSELISESYRITDAIYSCNWVVQNENFKKVLIIFMQSTQKDMTIIAGGVFPVSYATFIGMLKYSYSFFAVLIRVA